MISVIFPVLDERDGIEQVLDTFFEESLEPLRSREPVEVLVVDNGSTDGTREFVRGYEGVRLVEEEQQGYGHACRRGFDVADGDIVVWMDGDGSCPVEDIPRLVNEYKRADASLLIGNRMPYVDEHMSVRNRFGNWVLTTTMNILFGMHISDSQSGIMVGDRELLNSFDYTEGGFPFAQEVKLRVRGQTIVEVPVKTVERVGQRELDAWKDGLRNLYHLFRARVNGT